MPSNDVDAQKWVGAIFGSSMDSSNKWMITGVIYSNIRAATHRFEFVYLDANLNPIRIYGKDVHNWTVGEDELHEYFLFMSNESKEYANLTPVSRKIRQMEKRQKFQFKGAYA